MIADGENIPGQIAEAIFPGKKVIRMTINLEVGCFATVEAELFVGDELRTVLGIIGTNPAWMFVDKDQEGAA